MLIAMREWRERVGSRSFILFSVIGPLLVLGFIYLLFTYGGNDKQHWNVLIADPTNLLENKIMANEDESVTYNFANGYIEMNEFRDAKKYQSYDALLEVNEKVLSNKLAFVFYREKPSLRMQTRIQYQYERRLEEVMVKEFTDLKVSDFRKIKQPLNVKFKDVYDPNEQASDMRGWVGFVFGLLIFVFIFLFGMTILRSVTREKSNRIVEVVLASVRPGEMMFGKITGIGLAAFLQFLIWIVIIVGGLYLMRDLLFQDMLDASNLNLKQLAIDASDKTYQERYFSMREYNQFVELIYERIQYFNQISFFILFFIFGYLFYGSLFAAIGATMGSESDGQQFVIPIVLLLCFSIYGGYYYMNYPESSMATFLHYFPFTSPVVVMVKLALGYPEGESYQIYFSLFVLIFSALIMLIIAGRLYKNGILQFGHRLRLKHLLKWMRKA